MSAKVFSYLLAVAFLSSSASAQPPQEDSAARLSAALTAQLWQDPGDIATRDLYFGIGGKDRQPQGKFTFVKEDASGTTPKFIVKDEQGASWTVKLGEEVRGETAATRIVWSVGYTTDEDYFVPELHVQGMARLHRGQDLIEKDGSIRNARLERRPADAKKIGNWTWLGDPLTGTREMNGLIVLMALINNWDLKEDNTAIYGAKAGQERLYVVSDLGASFGAPGFSMPRRKGDVDAYKRSKFIKKSTPKGVSFDTPTRPALMSMVNVPHYLAYSSMQKIVQDIPREHARWMGQLLAKLSREQISQAFRASGYPEAEAGAFADVLMDRIAQLNAL